MALSIPATLILRTMFPKEFDEVWATIRREQPRFEAMNALIDRIPVRYRPLYNAYANYQDLPARDRDELARAIDDFEREEPENYALIMQTVESESRMVQ